MKNLRTLLFLVGIILTLLAFNASAKTKPHRTASAKAYYGLLPSKPKLHKRLKEKVDWRIHSKPAPGTKSATWSARKKYRAIYS